jgi:hypothetical protein
VLGKMSTANPQDFGLKYFGKGVYLNSKMRSLL